jgi:coenzyme F420 hydrogenase subunit beta
MRHPADLRSILSGDLCSGCGLCASLAGDGKIGMEMTAPGYLRPSVRQALTAEEDRAIVDVCPGARIEGYEAQGTAAYHPVWGNVVEVRAGYSTDPEVRQVGSSGGVLSALLLYLLERGEVEDVLQNAPDPDNPIGNVTQKSRNRADVLHAAGSRYAPSAPLARILDDIGGDGARHGFVGKPCDVAGLRNLLGRNPALKDRVPYVLSFMCAGMPSESGSREVLRRMEAPESDVESFRYRGNGWPGFATAALADGTTRQMDYQSSWGGVLSKHLQFRCKICPDGTGEFADVTCADAWYPGEDGYPSFQEQEGRSLIITRTERGEALVAAAAEAGYIVLEPLPVADIARMQPHQARRKGQVPARLLAMLLTGRRLPVYRDLGLGAVARTQPLRQHARNFAGTMYRLLRTAFRRSRRASDV